MLSGFWGKMFIQEYPIDRVGNSNRHIWHFNELMGLVQVLCIRIHVIPCDDSPQNVSQLSSDIKNTLLVNAIYM